MQILCPDESVPVPTRLDSHRNLEALCAVRQKAQPTNHGHRGLISFSQEAGSTHGGGGVSTAGQGAQPQHQAMAQAAGDCGPQKTPVVLVKPFPAGLGYRIAFPEPSSNMQGDGASLKE